MGHRAQVEGTAREDGPSTWREKSREGAGVVSMGHEAYRRGWWSPRTSASSITSTVAVSRKRVSPGKREFFFPKKPKAYNLHIPTRNEVRKNAPLKGLLIIREPLPEGR